MPLLAAVITAAAIFTGAIVAGGAPPPQPPFDYPSFGSGIGRTDLSRPAGDCGRAAGTLPLYPSQKRDEIPYQWVGSTAWTGKTLVRPRIFLARRPLQMRRWLYLTDPAPGYASTRKQLANVDFRKCSLLALFVPGNVDVALLGIRLNNPDTVTVGLYTTPHHTGVFCGTTTGISGTTTGSCSYAKPIDGSAVFYVLSANAVRSVDHLYGITQKAPPPPPPGTTTG